MSTDHKIAIIAITPNGLELAKRIRYELGEGHLFTEPKLIEGEDCSSLECIEQEAHEESQEAKMVIYSIIPSLSFLTKELFSRYDTLVFIMATGIVVRMIAPYLKDKFTDPAVLVIDEMGKNVISLLSGHMGGANEMTLKISRLIKANPVITTSTDVNHKAALDNIAKELDASITDFREAVKTVNAGLVRGAKIGLYQEQNYQIDTRGFTLVDSIEELESCEDFEKLICITHREKLEIESQKIIKVVPKDLVVGIGCRKDTAEELLEESFEDFLKLHNIDKRAVKYLASIEVKAEEKAILALADKRQIPFKIVTREEIAEVEHLFERSEFVKKNVGVCSVAEPTAYLVSGYGQMLTGKHKYQGITFAIGRIKR